jgi:hypothetical protein
MSCFVLFCPSEINGLADRSESALQDKHKTNGSFRLSCSVLVKSTG